MGRQIAVAGSEIGKPLGQQLEMQRLFGGDFDPIVEECARKGLAPRPRDNVPGEIDRVELDMGERMEERDTPRQ